MGKENTLFEGWSKNPFFFLRRKTVINYVRFFSAKIIIVWRLQYALPKVSHKKPLLMPIWNRAKHVLHVWCCAPNTSNVGKTMPCLPPMNWEWFIYTTYKSTSKNCDDWGMVQMALFYPHCFSALELRAATGREMGDTCGVTALRMWRNCTLRNLRNDARWNFRWEQWTQNDGKSL